MKKHLIIPLIIATTIVFGQVEEKGYIIINGDTTTFINIFSSWDSLISEKIIANISIDSLIRDYYNSKKKIIHDSFMSGSFVKNDFNLKNTTLLKDSILDFLIRSYFSSSQNLPKSKNLEQEKILEYKVIKKSRRKYSGKGGVVLIGKPVGKK